MSKFIDYFQIVGLAFFVIVFVGKTLYLHFGKNINPISLGIGKKGFRRILELAFFVGMILWIVEVILYALHTEFRLFPAPLDMSLIDTIPAKLIGVGLVLVAFIIFIWALVSFKDSWRVGIDEKTKGQLVTAGIFAISRNPIFLFVDIYFIGTFFINGTLIFLVFTVAAVIGMHYQMIQEERFMVKAYGQAYQDYCAKTARYLGWRRT